MFSPSVWWVGSLLKRSGSGVAFELLLRVVALDLWQPTDPVPLQAATRQKVLDAGAIVLFTDGWSEVTHLRLAREILNHHLFETSQTQINVEPIVDAFLAAAD